jgi:peptide deformylase
MIKDVLITGDDRLLEISNDIFAHEFNTLELDSLISDMLDTMHHNNGVGIAAIQIGIPKRIALIEYDENNPRYADIGGCPLTVVINPKIEVIGTDTSEHAEGCLSVPNQRGVVIRPKHLRYSFYDATGKLITGVSDSFFTRVLQHEIDHMNGILFPTRLAG